MECQNGKLFTLLIASVLLRVSQGLTTGKKLPTLIREKRLDVLEEPEPTGTSFESSGSGETVQKSIAHKYDRDFSKDETELDKDAPSHIAEDNDKENNEREKTKEDSERTSGKSRREDTSDVEKTWNRREASKSTPKRQTSSRTYYSRRPGDHDKVIPPGMQFNVFRQERKLSPPSKEMQKQFRLNMKRKKRHRLRALKNISIEHNDLAHTTKTDTESSQTSDQDNSGESSTDERNEEKEILPSSSRMSRLPKNFSLLLQAHASKTLSKSSLSNLKIKNSSNELRKKPTKRPSLKRQKRTSEGKASRLINNLLDTSSMKMSSTVKFTFNSPMHPLAAKPTSRPPTKSLPTTKIPTSEQELPPSLKEIPSQDLMMLNDFFNNAAAFRAQQIKVHSSPTKRQVHVSEVEEKQIKKFKADQSDEMPRKPSIYDDDVDIMKPRNMTKGSGNVEKDDGSNAYAKELLDFQRKALEAEEKRLDKEIASAKHVSHLNHHKSKWDPKLKELNEANQEKENNVHELFHALNKEWKHHKTLPGKDAKNKEMTTASNETNNGDDVQQLKKLDNENQEKQNKIHGLFSTVSEEWKQHKLTRQDGKDNEKVTTDKGKNEEDVKILKKGITRRQRRKMMHPGELGVNPKTNGGNDPDSDGVTETAFYEKDQPATSTPTVSPSKGPFQEGHVTKDGRLEKGADINHEQAMDPTGKNWTTLTGSKYNTPTRGSIEANNTHNIRNDSTMNVKVAKPLEHSHDGLHNAKDVKENNDNDDDDDDDVETTVKQDDDDDDYDDNVPPSYGGRNPGFGNSKINKEKVNASKHNNDISYNLSQITNMDHIKDDIEDDDSHKNKTNINHKDNNHGRGNSSQNFSEEEVPQDNRLLYILTGDPEHVEKIHKQKELEKNKLKLIEIKKQENKRKLEALVNKIQLDEDPNQGIFHKRYFNKELKSKLKDMEVRVLDAHQKVSKELEEIERHLTEKYEKLQNSITRAKSLTKDMDSKINDTVLHVIKLAKVSADRAKTKIRLVQKAASALTDIEKKIGANDTRNVARVIKSRIAELPINKYRSYQRILAMNNIITKMDGAKIIAENKANASYSTKDDIEKNMADAATNVLRELTSTEKELEDDTKVELEDEREANEKIEDAERRNFKVALKSGDTLKKIEGYLEQLEKDELKLRNMKTLESW